jgi:hypothetical protein
VAHASSWSYSSDASSPCMNTVPLLNFSSSP